ncbi:MAG TPA: hypothetical protein VG675_01825 [Bryobacteraceae bacterium]|nr:hypothetical protein [Bryobacteraceae bacterium]
MRLPKWLSGGLLVCGLASGQSLNCDLHEYKPLDGLKAAVEGGVLDVTWQGTSGQQLRAEFGIQNGQPTIRELAVRKNNGWVVLASNLVPEFQVTSGMRRLSGQQVPPLRQLNMFTPEIIEREKWNTFWDSPLSIPGKAGSNASIGLPRKPEEVRRAWASFHASACQVKTDGARLEMTFPGVEMGIFAGDLRFTVYRGTNLLRQEVIAKTEEPSVAYKYLAGLKGFAIGENTRIVWRDTARAWQHYAFGGAVNTDPVALRARNRLGIVETGKGSVAFFPPSHKFFFSREVETNLGYVYYRKDGENSFAVGVRQADREEGFKPYGYSDAVWRHRVSESREETENFALYNAPPGTWQHMPVYFYLDAGDGAATQQAVMAFTHDDVYKPLPGYQVLVSHFHFHLNEELTDAGTIDHQPSWIPVFRALGVNIAILADFHADSHPSDTGTIRLNEQKVYFEGCERFSDRDFLLIPGEEPDANFGGHYMFVFPRPVYFTHTMQRPGRSAPPPLPFVENISPYGKVYHTATSANEMALLNAEDGLVWQTHPRTKSSAGYPDAVKDQEHFLTHRFLGASFQSLPVDQSEKRLCEKRCLGLLDDMNNWQDDPKYMIAEGDTYTKYPDDETYPQLVVNYVKLDRVPKFDDGWKPVLQALRDGKYFVTSGEVLLRDSAIEGTGTHRTFTADVEWTFPLEFVELVWGDGKTTGSQILSGTDLPPMSNHRFRIPFDAAGKKWVRFAAWDSAGNGAITQPVHLGN